MKIGVITECLNEWGRDASSKARVRMREWVSQNGSKFVEDDGWKAIRRATELEFDATD